MKTQSLGKRSAFTLVELLVVIAIITILAALITAGAFWALLPAKDAAIQLNIKDMNTAIDAYAAENGKGYFPTETITNQGKQAFLKHLRKRFRYHTETLTVANVPDLDASETVVYFLGGNALYPTSPGAQFSIKNNSVRPITAPGGEIEVEFDFDVSRLKDLDGDGFFSYIPKYVELESNAPIVYFAAADYGQTGTVFPPPGYMGQPVTGVAIPYLNSASPNNAPCEANRFQLICAGQDGHFGANAVRSYPAGTNYDVGGADDDNITNFSEGRVGNKLP